MIWYYHEWFVWLIFTIRLSAKVHLICETNYFFIIKLKTIYIYIALSKSDAKLAAFQSQIKASYVSCHTEELWHNETVCLRMTMYIYIYIYIYIYMYIYIYIYIYCPHWADICKSLLVDQHLSVHVLEFMRESHFKKGLLYLAFWGNS